MNPRNLKVTLNEYYSLTTHTKQLLLVTFCDKTAGSGVRFRTHRRKTEDRRTDGWTDKRGSRNSYLDVVSFPLQWHTTVFTHNSQDDNEYIMCLLSLFRWWKNNPFLLHDAFIDT